jgi:prepilin-type N-terminal cleavage/methylation domain-containing protein/prepilin-type processing-associated H-X9-DG protein
MDRGKVAQALELGHGGEEKGMTYPRRGGFTLIELLVVVTIIGLLVSLLLPALGAARRTAKLVACLGNVQQLGVGVYAYAAEARGVIPTGPETPFLSPTSTWARNISNWVWVEAGPDSFHNAHGVLLDGYLTDNRAMFCPGTDSPQFYGAQLDNYQAGGDDIFSAYLYRQLDQTQKPFVDDLGRNDAGLPARALFADANRFGPPGDEPATNHTASRVTVGFVDGHAKIVDNAAGWLQTNEIDYASPPQSIADRLAVMLQAMDFSETGSLDAFSP